MMNAKQAAAIAASALLCFVTLASETISIDRVQQRYPWSGDVDIDYTLTGVDSPRDVFVRFSVRENPEAEPVVLSAFADISPLFEPSNGSWRATWQSSREKSGHFFSTNAVFSAELVYSPGTKTTPYTFDYLIVDLSGGAQAEEYPVSYMQMTVAEALDFFDKSEYKTTKLVLRRVGACTFSMGCAPQPHFQYLGAETVHEVTLTKDFYIGIYEVTQKQYELVAGVAAQNPECPAVNVTCNMMRGDTGPVRGEPSADSFFGLLRAKTSLAFDSPYEAQWECACKAGTETVWYTGYDSVDGEYAEPLSTIAWHEGNSSGAAHAVGGKLPNAWGIYDMVGNVWEWCRDGAPQDLGSAPAVDPSGDASLTARVGRGGSFKYGVHFDHQTVRTIESWDSYHDEVGFRASLTVE